MQITTQPALEVVHFQSNPEVTDSQRTEAANNMLETLQSWTGFIKRELIKVSDNQWIDVVHWTDSEAAMMAQESAMQSEACLGFCSLMTVSEEQMYHGNIVLTLNA
ncbi:MAG: hypothetical protein GY951_09475 [Psychromonas sp.]|nr:hypothetical protein [Alteromonadales bacterium]MCP5078269.1 hypothetical protein [Psychromonas sp.]